MLKRLRLILISLFLLVTIMFILSDATFSQSKSQLKENTRGNSNKGNNKITGIIADSLTNRPIESANFILYRFRDSSVFNGSSTDSAGRFILKNIPDGAYSARVSVVGYKSRKRNLLTLTNDSTLIDLDTIRLIQRSIATSEVQVTAGKENIVYDEDKIVINVNRSMGNNAAEVLESTPMVNVDIDGKISLVGRPGAAVYIDGVPAKYTGIETADDLKILSTADIEKVEIILNPSFEFSERTGNGIINIITKKKPASKYSGYSAADGNTRNQYKLGLGINYRYSDFYTRIYYTTDNSKYNSSSGLLKTITLNDEVKNLEQKGIIDNRSGRNLIALNFGYNIDKVHVLNSGISYNLRTSDNHRFLTNNLSDQGTDNSEYFESTNLTNTRQGFFNSYLAYNRIYDEKGRKLAAMVSYFDNSMDLNSKIEKGYIAVSESYKKDNSSKNINNTLKLTLSYAQPLWKNTKIEMGYNGTFKNLDMNNLYKDFDNFRQIYIETRQQELKSKYDDFRQYCYGNFRGKMLEIEYDLGLTFETVRLSNNDLITGNSYVSDYNDIAPYFLLSKKLLEGHVLRIGATRQSDFPENRQLNPHIDYSDSTNIEMGNPNLEPSYTNSFSIDYSITNKDLFFRAGASYNNKKNIIEQITSQQTAYTAVTTYMNIASSRTLNTYLYASKKLSDWLQIDPQLDLYKREYNGTTIKNSGFMWNTGIRSTVSFKNFKFQMDARYTSPEIGAQSESRAKFYANAAVKILFFDKALSLTLRAQDIFNTLNQNKSIYGTGFYGTSSVLETTRIISLGISYYFQSKAEDSIEDRSYDEKEDDF